MLYKRGKRRDERRGVSVEREESIGEEKDVTAEEKG